MGSLDKMKLPIIWLILAIIFFYSDVSKSDLDFSIIGPTSKDPQHVIIQIHTNTADIDLKIEKEKLEDIDYISEQIKNVLNGGKHVNGTN